MGLTIYKKGQGAAARGICAALALLVGGWAGHQMWYTLFNTGMTVRVVGTVIVALLFGGVPVYLLLFNRRIVDVLIETQMEMRKVAWSTRAEVIGSTTVVIITVVMLTLFIFVTDRILLWVAGLCGIY